MQVLRLMRSMCCYCPIWGTHMLSRGVPGSLRSACRDRQTALFIVPPIIVYRKFCLRSNYLVAYGRRNFFFKHIVPKHSA